MNERTSEEIVDDILQPDAHMKPNSVLRPRPARLHDLLAGEKSAFVAAQFPPPMDVAQEMPEGNSFESQESSYGNILMMHLFGSIREPNEVATFIALCTRLQAEDKGSPIILNFADVTYFEKSAISYLLGLKRWNIRLSNLPESLEIVLKTTGLRKLFKIFTNEMDAIQSFGDHQGFDDEL